MTDEAVAIVLAHDDQKRLLTPAETESVLGHFAAAAREAAKWVSMTQRPGRLIIIDPQLVSEIERFLDDGREPNPA